MKLPSIATGLAFLLAWTIPQVHSAEVPTKVSFENDVRPVLKAYCLDCHGGAAKLKGGLDLRLKRFAVKGGDSGPAVVPGDAGHSLLVSRMKSGEMPPGEKKVPADKLAVVEAWIKAGAPALRDEPAQLPPGIDISPAERAYWFYQPLQRPPTPKYAPTDRVRSPIDALVLAKLREKGLGFNADADPLVLVRRASLDLTGLPPTQSEIDEFRRDQSGHAYENLLDRLLASPHYGERWARHWLDVAGYADSEGNPPVDTPRPWAWKYRDYVVRSLNADKPLDQFIQEQLAGDELVPLPWNNLKPEQAEILAATGFLRMAPDATATGGGPAEANQVVADTLKIVSSTLLGVTVGCAQCHDHRYDPVPQVDYYRLRAIFEPAFDPVKWRRIPQRLVSLYTDADRARAKVIDAEAEVLQKNFNDQQANLVKVTLAKVLEKAPADQRDALQTAILTPPAKQTPAQKKLVAANPKLNVTAGTLSLFDSKAAEELKKLQAVVTAKRAEKPVEEFIAVANEVPGPAPVTRLFHRGDYRQPLEAVQPGDLTIAAPDGKRLEVSTKSSNGSSSGRRLAYARHLTNGEHPLLGRVLANRIWHHHFGRGIVETLGDFGMLGLRPSHPELLDWLADELVRQGWSLKKMHKLIMTSTVYRQSSQHTPAQDRVDAANVLLGRYPLRRLEAEIVRDRILATSGKLDRTLFGPAVAVKEDMVGQVVAPDDQPRRSIYLQVRRTKPLAFLAAFDAPANELNCDRRMNSTSAPQALMLMNSDFVLQQADLFAKRLQREAPADPGMRTRVGLAWQLAFQRFAAPEELESAGRFLERQVTQLRAAKHADPDLAALTNLCQQMISANEFLYVD